ncbi:hypothetical protein HOP50_05g40530 [Chloropicon primus]|uniref:Uncharacterized protein n=1 Tax=Chloropicon primus TaxID=1764295 RepID=A0A5B8MLX1_9CHLO|nr:hypothetical protein A3770_05p40440 [Chloropicon primus]UPR00737.1 hypothetical protein HOP50_05g40530 [Chloropicon primus]|eukprot:QDZ21526.1 hypothetical protein A3770_05p40440 [Chloropicon primus]
MTSSSSSSSHCATRLALALVLALSSAPFQVLANGNPYYRGHFSNKGRSASSVSGASFTRSDNAQASAQGTGTPPNVDVMFTFDPMDDGGNEAKTVQSNLAYHGDTPLIGEGDGKDLDLGIVLARKGTPPGGAVMASIASAIAENVIRGPTAGGGAVISKNAAYTSSGNEYTSASNEITAGGGVGPIGGLNFIGGGVARGSFKASGQGPIQTTRGYDGFDSKLNAVSGPIMSEATATVLSESFNVNNFQQQDNFRKIFEFGNNGGTSDPENNSGAVTGALTQRDRLNHFTPKFFNGDR